MPLLYFVVVLLLVGLEGYLVYKATANWKRARLLADTPVAKVAERSMAIRQPRRPVHCQQPLGRLLRK